MDKENCHVMIFALLPATSGWRGEGIAQTVENIIRYSADKVTYSLVIGKHVEKEIAKELSEKIIANRLKLVPVGFISKKLNRGSTNFVTHKIAKLLFCLSLSIFVIKQMALQVLRKSKYHLTFVPIPLLAIPASLFSKKMVISFWDAFVLEYPHAFSKSVRMFIIKLLKCAMYSADVVVTQSKMNKNYLVNFFGMNSEKIKVIENGHPDYKCYVGKQTITTEDIMLAWNSEKESVPGSKIKLYYHYWLKKATQKSLQDHLKKDVLHRLITKDSTKETKIIFVSTQYRVYKGFESLFVVFDALIKKYCSQYRFKFVFTAAIPKIFYQNYHWATSLVFEMQGLSSYQHACIYSIADLVIHPSFVEGGPGTYPMFEAASLNIPSLSNMGRHMLGLQEKCGKESIDTLCVDLIDVEGTAEKIFALLTNMELQKQNVSLINSIRVSWEDSGKEYQDLFRVLRDL